MNMERIKFLYESNIEKITSIKKLSGGLSNEIYLINNFFLWKIFKNKYLFNHLSEKKIIEESTHLKLHYWDSDNICYTFIEGDNIDNTFFKKNFDQVISLTKKYHELDIKIDNFWYDIIPKWLGILPDTHLSFTTKKELLNKYQEINKTLIEYNNEKVVVCHHDIHSGNIIKKHDNNLELIDLEFSFLNYYFVDLGNIICEYYTNYDLETYNYQLIDDDIIVKTLELYDKEITERNIKQIMLGIKISHYYWCLWGLIIDLNGGETNFNYKKFAKERYHYL